MASEPPDFLPSGIRLQASELQGALNREEYDLHELALEWGLSEPIIIRDEEDIKAKASWKDKLQPFEHQVQNLITFCRRLPVSIIADDVGLGKTVSAGLILSELIVRRKVNRCLVVCTKLIAPQWIEELRDKFGIDGKWETGSAVRSLFRGDATVVATSYESVRDHMSAATLAGFDMLILDEAHKLRNLYGANAAPRMATVVRKALEDRVFKYVLMLTATPMQNRIWDLYSLIDCLAVAKGHDNPFGNYAAFATAYGNPYKQAGWSSSASGKKFRETLRQYLVRARRATVRLAFPKRELRLERVPATTFDKQLMTIIANALDDFPQGKGLISSSLGIAMMSSPHALRKQLHNMAEKDRMWQTAAREVEDVVKQYHNPAKLDAVIEVCSQLRRERPGNWRLVIFTCRLETLNLIVRRLQEMQIAVGVIQGGAGGQNQKTIQRYASDPPEVNVIVSTDSGAEGVNLQAGNVMINYDLPWNPMVLEQRIGRVQRLGSKFESVVIFNLAVKDSPEDRVVARLLNKLTEISESVGDIESILESASEESGNGKPIEEQIREMVTASLMGQNIETQRRLAEESVINAKRRLEENEKELNQNLGDLTDLHHSGVRPPDLSQLIPSRPVHDFIQDGLRLLGHRVTLNPQYGDNVFVVRYAGERTEKLAAIDRTTWKELRAAAHMRQCDLYQPGQPLFERLVQTWRERAASHVIPLHGQTEQWAHIILEHWLQQIPEAVLGQLTFSNRKMYFGGSVRSLVRASNGVDQYEKLLMTQYRVSDHEPLAFDTETIRVEPLESFDLKKKPNVRGAVSAAVQSDDDIEKFCSFYASRLLEELPNAGASEMRRKKIKDDFTVSVEANTVSTEGFEYESCDVAAEVIVGGVEHYQLKFSLIPATGQITDESPIWEFCEQSKNEYPTEFMGRCDFSDTRSVRHLLLRSEESDRRSLATYMEMCARTGKRAIQDEFLTSSYSGARAVRSEFQKSSVSEQIYLPEELAYCEFTNARAGIDELRISDVSQRRFRGDQSETCCVSGAQGHRSEFIRCEVSGLPVVPGELGISSVSGRRVASNLLEVSQRDPSRVGLADEIVVCEISGRRVLCDEVDRCSHTGHLVDSFLLKRCEESDDLVLAELLVICGSCGMSVAPKQTEICAVTSMKVIRRLCSQSAVSGLYALTSQCAECDFTHATILPDEKLISDCSGRPFRRDEAIMSELSRRIGHQSEEVVCAVSGQLLLQDEAAASELSGIKANVALLQACAVSGKKLLPSELKTCEFTGALVSPEELFVSDESGRLCVRRERAVSEISGKQGHASEFSSCEVTYQYVLQSELSQCSITGKKAIADECFQSPLSGRIALKSLATKCEITGELVLADELVRSQVSGRRFSEHLAVKSEKTGRRGHQSEAVTCAVSNKLLLSDEVAVSAVSGKITDQELLVRCGVSGVLALAKELQYSDFSDTGAVPAEMRTSAFSEKRYCSTEGFTSEISGKLGHISEQAVCQLTGRRVLLSEVTICAVTGRLVSIEECLQSAVSGKFAIASEFSHCEFTNAAAIQNELVVSQLAGKRFRCDQSACSEKSGRIGHESEARKCDVSGKLLLMDELLASELSGKLVDEKLLAVCSVTGKKALLEELAACDFTGARAIPAEMRISDVSGQRFCSNQLFKSQLSGKIGHLSETGSCEITGKQVFHSELVRCEITHRQMLPSECEVSPISGRIAGRDSCGRCEITQVMLMPDELIVSDISGKQFRRDEAVRSPFSKRFCHVSEAIRCHYTGKLLLKDETECSDLTRKITASFELETALASGRKGRAEEFVTCAVSQRRFLMDEVAKSVVSGLQVDRKLLVASAGSGQLALRNELESCVVTGLLLLPTELSASAVSGRRADRRLLIRSDFSEHLALPDELLVCGESGRRGVPSDGVVCSETAQWVGRQYATTCTVTGKPVRASVGVRSAISDRFMAPSVALRSIKTKSMLHPDETTFCHWNEGYLEKDETAMCHRTLLTFSGNLIDASGQFNRIVPLLFQDPNREDGTPFIELCRKAEPEKLKRLRRLIFFRKNPDSKILFFRGHVDSKWYMSVYYVVFAARWHKDSFEIITPLTTSDETSGWKELS